MSGSGSGGSLQFTGFAKPANKFSFGGVATSDDSKKTAAAAAPAKKEGALPGTAAGSGFSFGTTKTT